MNGTESRGEEHLLGTYPEDSELVLGFVYAVGTDYSCIVATLENYIKQYNYRADKIRLSECLADYISKLGLQVDLSDENEEERIRSRMKAGNALREATRHWDILALHAASHIYAARTWPEGALVPEPLKKTVHIVLSLKRPEEVYTLRKIYGPGFFAVGVFSSETERLEYLTKEKAVSEPAANSLINIDADEDDKYGQRTRDTFRLADVFIRYSNGAYKDELLRFLDLVFGFPYHTPTVAEHAMFLAYAASLRSGDLSRQVGAAIVSESNDILAVGCNDVPRPGGGLYWPGDDDQRDWKRGHDSNELEKMELATKIVTALRPSLPPEERLAVASKELRETGFFDITEFGRSVHAEMDALLTCARSGVSTRGVTLYTTTFPCHNCTRHLIAAGVKKVVYIEPYPKSKAFVLHDDAVSVDEGDSPGRVPFMPFIGIGPRRYFDLFSLSLGGGYPVQRKVGGGKMDWQRENAVLRVPMQPRSYLQRELVAASDVKDLIRQEGLSDHVDRQSTTKYRSGLLGEG